MRNFDSKGFSFVFIVVLILSAMASLATTGFIIFFAWKILEHFGVL